MKWVAGLSLVWAVGWLVWVPINANIRASSPHSYGGQFVAPGELAVGYWPWTPAVYFAIFGAVVFLAAVGGILGEKRRKGRQNSS